jgi:hypothetical protein
MRDDLQDTRADCKTLPIIACDAKLADGAYAIYAAMKRTEIDQPVLAETECWVTLRTIAFMMFYQAFEVQQ